MSNTVNVKLDTEYFEMMIHQAFETVSALNRTVFDHDFDCICKADETETMERNALLWLDENYPIAQVSLNLIWSALNLVSDALSLDLISIAPGKASHRE